MVTVAAAIANECIHNVTPVPPFGSRLWAVPAIRFLPSLTSATGKANVCERVWTRAGQPSST